MDFTMFATSIFKWSHPLVSASYKNPTNNEKTQNMLIYLEKRAKDLELEEQEFRKMVLNKKYNPIKNQQLILEDSES